MSREEQDEAGASYRETCTPLLPALLCFLGLLWSACFFWLLLIWEYQRKHLHSVQKGRIAKSLLQNSLERDALAKLQEVMKRLPNAQAKRHDSLQPRQEE